MYTICYHCKLNDSPMVRAFIARLMAENPQGYNTTAGTTLPGMKVTCDCCGETYQRPQDILTPNAA